MSSILADQKRSRVQMRGLGGVALSQPMRRPNKLWRSNSIFNLCYPTFPAWSTRRMISPLPCTLKYTSLTFGAISSPQIVVFGLKIKDIATQRDFTLGLYSETGFHFGMDRNFVCLWRRHNCRSQVFYLSLSALIS
jgi:hypothetical protein